MGLVKQCLSSLYKKNIQRLTKVRHGLPLWPLWLFLDLVSLSFPLEHRGSRYRIKWQSFYTKRESVAAGFLERV